MISLEVDQSNNNPKIPATFFLDAVQNVGGCPRIVRSDCGTEKVVLAAMQCYFRKAGNDQGCHGQGKVREKQKFFKVREKSGNFAKSQGKSQFLSKSVKSQGILFSGWRKVL